jgi:hypothetical protein
MLPLLRLGRTHREGYIPLYRSITRQTHTYTHMHICTYAHTHTHSHTHSHTHMHTHMHTHSHTHMHTHTHTHMHKHTHTHTLTHTHTQSCKQQYVAENTVPEYDLTSLSIHSTKCTLLSVTLWGSKSNPATLAWKVLGGKPAFKDTLKRTVVK